MLFNDLVLSLLALDLSFGYKRAGTGKITGHY